MNLNIICNVIHWLGGLGTFRSREEQVICGIHTEDWFGVALGHMDALEFGTTVALWGWHGIDHAPVMQTHDRNKETGVSLDTKTENGKR